MTDKSKSNFDDDDDDDLSGSFEDFLGDDEIDDDDVTDFLNDDTAPEEGFAAAADPIDDDDVAGFLSSDDNMSEPAEPAAVHMDDDDVADFLNSEDELLAESDDVDEELAVPDDDDDRFSDSDVEVAELPGPAHGTMQSPFYGAPDSLPVPMAAADSDDDDFADDEFPGDDAFPDDDAEDGDLVPDAGAVDGATQQYSESIESEAVSDDDAGDEAFFDDDQDDDYAHTMAVSDDEQLAAEEEWVTGSNDTLDNSQGMYESGQEAAADSDIEVDDPSWSVSMGRAATQLPDAGFAGGDSDTPRGGSSKGPRTQIIGPDDAEAGLSSRVWGTSSSRDGVSSALSVRERPVSGREAPFTIQEDADYEVIDELARGGMGVVYNARQMSLDRMLAIKTLKLPGHGSQSGHSSKITGRERELFLFEALVTANLVHPNIVPIHDLCQTADGIPFYSMKRVKGFPWVSGGRKTAQQFANDPIRSMSLAENLEVLLKVCDGVAYAHSEGVVNRDLKPENVIIGDFGEVIVLDWGLAIFTPDSGRSNPTSFTTTVGAGTPAYMAPEQWTGPSEAIGRATDIYLLGAMLFEALTGHAPHKFEIVSNVAQMSPSEQYQLKQEQLNEVVGGNKIRATDQKGELYDIAMKALSTRPDDRYRSVQEFQAAVREYQRHEESRHLGRRADQLLEGKTGSAKEGYEDYQTAAALYEEALRNWEGNRAASQGLFDARLNNAKLAYKRGDYDLGLQLVAHRDDAGEYQAIRKKLLKAKKRRGATKWTITALIGTIMIGGPIAAGKFYLDNKALNEAGIKIETATADAEAKKALADAAQETARIETEKAATAIRVAETAQEEANQATAAVAEANADLVKANADLATARAATEQAAIALQRAKDAEEAAKKDTMIAEAAETKAREAVKLAEAERVRLEAEKTALEAEKVAIEAEKNVALKEQKVASFEVEMQKAASATVSMNFEDAKKRIEDLLTSDQLNALDETSKAQRINELTAQKQQLERLLSTPTETPVQSQRLSSDGTLVAWLHAPAGQRPGRVTIRSLDAETGKPTETATNGWTLNSGALADIQFVPGQTVLACLHGPTLTLWNYVDDTRTTVATSASNFTALEIHGQTLITAAQGGLVTAWNQDGSSQWSYDTETEVRDLQMLPSQNVLICAGSRANTSADVLALQITANGARRLEDQTQLLLTRETIAPPQAVAVSPRGAELMVLGNSRNGSVLILPKSSPESSETVAFPFQSPIELSKSGSRDWLQTRHRRPVNAIAFSADGTRFATASDDRTIGIWTVQRAGTGQVTVTWDRELQLQGHGAAVTDVAFLDDSGKRLLSTSRDRSSRVWNLDTYVEDLQRILNNTTSETDTVDTKELTPRERTSASATIGRRPDSRPDVSSSASVPAARSWRTMRRPRYQFTSHPSTQPASLDDRPYIVLNGGSQAAGRQEVLRGGIRSVDITADGSRIVTGGVDGTAVLWDSSSGSVVRGASQEVSFHRRSRLFEEGHKFNVSQLMFLPPHEHICLSTSFDGSLCLWQANPDAGDFGAEKNRLTDLRLVNAVAVAPDGTFLVTTAFEEQTADATRTDFPCRIWNVAQLLTGDTPATDGVQLSGFHRDIVTAITVSDDNLMIATGSKDGFVALWSAVDGRLLGSVRAHNEKTLVTDLAWLSDNALLTVGVDGDIRRWDVSTDTDTDTVSLKLAEDYQGDTRSPVDRLAVSPDRTQFLTIHATFLKSTEQPVYEAKVRRIDERVGRAIRLAVAPRSEWTIPKNPQSAAGLISSVAWSADGTQVAIVAGGQINLLETSTWKVTKTIVRNSTGHESRITAAVFPSQLSASTGRNLVATFDGTATQLWDIDSGALLTTFQPQQSVSVAALSNDEEHRFLATGSETIRIFNSAEDDPGYAQTRGKVLNPHAGGVTALAFAPNDRQLASGGRDGRVKIWDWEPANARLNQVAAKDLQSGPVTDLKWSADGTTLLAIAEQQASLMNVTTQDAVLLSIDAVAAGGITLRCGDFKQDGSAIVLGGRSDETGGSLGLIFRLDPATGDFVHKATFEGHGAGGISCVEFVETADSPYLVSGGDDGAAIVWNWSGLTPHQAYRFLSPDLAGAAHRAVVTDLAVSTTGTVVTCSDDGTAIVWQNPLVITNAL